MTLSWYGGSMTRQSIVSSATWLNASADEQVIDTEGIVLVVSAAHRAFKPPDPEPSDVDERSGRTDSTSSSIHSAVFSIDQSYPSPATSGAISAYDHNIVKPCLSKIDLTRWVTISHRHAT